MSHPNPNDREIDKHFIRGDRDTNEVTFDFGVYETIERLLQEARIDELGGVQLGHGRYTTTTYISGKPQSILERIAELKEEAK